MLLFTTLSQLIVSISIISVWTLRFKNVKEDFKKFRLSNFTRDMVGVTKTLLSIVLLFGLFWTSMTIPSAIILSLFMVAAQYFHWNAKNSFYKHLPSLILLFLLIFIIFSFLTNNY
jgi:hypothetical protein